MSQVVTTVSSSAVKNTITLTTSYVDLCDYTIENGRVFVTMRENNQNIGAITFLVSGGIAKSVGFTGGVFFSESLDVSLLPVSYGASTNQNYTIFFIYENSKLRVAKGNEDPEVEVTFSILIDSAAESYPNSVQAVDKIVENTENAGTTFENKVIFNGGIETSNLASGQITFSTNDSHLTFTNVSSKATSMGQMCNVVIKATLSVSGMLLTKGSEFEFFELTPQDTYKCTYRALGHLLDDTTKDVGVIYVNPNTSKFTLILPRSMGIGSSTTLIASITYFAS